MQIISGASLLPSLSGAPHLPQYMYPIQSLSKIDENPLWAFLLLQYMFLISFLLKNLYRASLFLQCIFLIQFVTEVGGRTPRCRDTTQEVGKE